jgi:hypothetical protein
MKTVIFLLAAFCGSVFAAGNDLVIPQRLADDTQRIDRLVAKPAGTNDGVLGYLGSTQRPYFLGIGPGLSLSNGVLDSATSAPTWSAITGKPSFSAVATSGAYADLSGKPSIPAAQVQSDWNATSGVSAILNKPVIAAQKRTETYTGVTDASGLCTVTYSTAYPAIPSVQPGPPSDSTQSWILVRSTTTGFSVRLVQRAVLTVVSVQVLAGVVSNVPSAPCQVLVVGQ